jgi:hypothetical protein
VVASGRSAVAIDAGRAAWRRVAELLGRDLEVMRIAEVSCVPVLVAAAQRQRLDVVDHRRHRGPACRQAHLAQTVGALQAAQTVIRR